MAVENHGAVEEEVLIDNVIVSDRRTYGWPGKLHGLNKQLVIG